MEMAGREKQSLLVPWHAWIERRQHCDVCWSSHGPVRNVLLQSRLNNEYSVEGLLQGIIAEHSFRSASELLKELLSALSPSVSGGLLLEREQVLSHDVGRMPNNLHCLTYLGNVIHLASRAASPRICGRDAIVCATVAHTCMPCFMLFLENLQYFLHLDHAGGPLRETAFASSSAFHK